MKTAAVNKKRRCRENAISGAAVAAKNAFFVYTVTVIVDDPRVKKEMRELCGVLAVTGDRELLESFFSCLLTPAETADIASRWALVKALREGISQREIAKNLGLSLCKITRGSRELKKSGSAFQRILKVLDNLNAE